MKSLRFAIVGCGAVTLGFHLPALRRCEAVELVAVSDIDHQWARTVANRFRVPGACRDFRELIGRVDAALVATPNATHADISCALLDAGIHVLCEKPVATTRAEAERMFATSARTGARLMVGHCFRFSPSLAMLKQVVTDGWLGPLTQITGGIGRLYDLSPHRTDFRLQRSLSGGGVLIDLGIHLIDLAVWLAGDTPVELAYEGSLGRGWEVEHDADVLLEFPSGRAILSSSYTRRLSNAIVVRGRNGWASTPLDIATALNLFSDQAPVCRRAGVQQLRFPDISMYDQQIAHFCHGVRTGDEFAVRTREVLAGMAVIDQCYRMAATTGSTSRPIA